MTKQIDIILTNALNKVAGVNNKVYKVGSQKRKLVKVVRNGLIVWTSQVV